MNTNLLGNLEGNTPLVKLENSCKKQGSGVLGLVLLAVFSVFLNGKVYGQSGVLDEGLYYIKINGNQSIYLWRAITEKTTGQPYLSGWNATTFSETVGGQTYSFDQAHCTWIVKQVTVSGNTYNTIMNVATEQYVVWDTYSSGTGKAVHLETRTQAPTSTDDHCFFIIYKSNSNYYIHPDQCNHNNTENTRGLNYKGDFRLSDKLCARDGDGRGLIQFYNGTTNDTINITNASDVPAPSINYDPDLGSYTITTNLPLDGNYVIRYTDNGNDPTINSPVYDGSTVVVQQDGTTVKAIVTGYGMVLTKMDTQVMNAVVPEAPSFEVTCDSKLQINSNLPTARIYYNFTTDGSDPDDPDNTSTEWTEPVEMDDNAKIKAVAYNGNNPTPSTISDIYTFFNNTVSPTINLTETQAEITFGSGVTIHYTTNGTHPNPEDTGENTSPFVITELSYDDDVDIRVIATSSGHGNSCPVTVVRRPKRPTIVASSECVGINRIHTLTFTDTEVGKTYWYALSNQGESQPSLDAFTEYTPGSVVSIDTIHTWDGTSINVTLYAYAKTADDYISHLVSENYLLKHTDAPTITHAGQSVTISAATNATIHYSIDGVPKPDVFTSTTFTVDGGQSHIITATAQYGSEGESCETVYVITLSTTISSLQQLNAMTANGAYVLGKDIDVNGEYTTMTSIFTGSFDGAGHTITGLTQPLFGTTNGAVIHDVNLKEVQISKAGDVGAIVCDAKGYTRIYNCGILPTNADFSETTRSSVTSTGSGSAGGLVGKLEDDSRVVNCFSYADVSSTGYAAGIVGNNTFASTAEVENVSGTDKYTHLRTMVVNCMFYGDITNGSDVWPVYGGTKITNNGTTAINNYNYYSDSCSFPEGKKPSTTHQYNCSWPAQYKYLTLYEFHRNLLNSNRELCGWWVGSPHAPSTMSTANVQAVPKDASLMAKWVLDPDEAPFPILKTFGKYSSPVNIDADSSWRVTANEWEGKKLGTLSVTVKSGTHHTATPIVKSLTITDMDTLRGDYCYRKIQLPYYNSVFGNPDGTTWEIKYAGNYSDSVVTGWKITKVNDSSEGSGDFLADWQDGYNFADRTSTKKDLYDVSYRVFAQGGFYYVPDDVTSIEIEAYWGKAYYLGNSDDEGYYDRVDLEYLITVSNISQANSATATARKSGSAFAPAGKRPNTLPNGKTILTGKIADVARGCITSEASVYDNALVLVNNHQYCTGKEDVVVNVTGTNPNYTPVYNTPFGFTIMSADFNLDDEPDYCLEWQLGHGTTRQSICPIRFDFLPVVEVGIALKKDGSRQYYSLGCYRPIGHYEVTETALIRFGQFEFGHKSRTKEAPLILNAGIFEQYVKGTEAANHSNSTPDDINYVIIGGHVYMPSFTPGAHVNSNASFKTRHCAVNAIGGRIDYLYLTGNYNEKITKPNPDNPHCYIDGGWIDHVAAAGKEGIGDATATDPKGNVTFKINHARIKEFYGGSVMKTHPVTGNIEVTINNSIVDKYCGGPKFGNMSLDEDNPANNKRVTTEAKGTTFGVYYGAGNGGTNYVQYKNYDNTNLLPNGTFNWNGTGLVNGYHVQEYLNADTGYMANYELSIVNVSSGTIHNAAVTRTYFFGAQYSATNTGPVTNILDSCIVKGNFYGAGNLGGVFGNVISTLNDTEVRGSVFGAGFSATIPEVQFHSAKEEPFIDVYTGIITPPGDGTINTYRWTHSSGTPQNPITNNPNYNGIDELHYFYTDDPLINLGAVNGNVTLTIEGKSTIGTFENGMVKHGTGNVFGGGDESAVGGGTLVKILDRTKVFGNIYGGGNMGKVSGDTKVIINGTVPDETPTGNANNNNPNH